MTFSPVSSVVLGAAAVVVSPTIWFAVQGSVPLHDALTRYLLLVPVCWAAINLVAEFFFPAPGAASRSTGDETSLLTAAAGSPYEAPGLDAGFDSGFGQPGGSAYGSESYGGTSFDAGFTPFDPAGAGQADASTESTYDATTQPGTGPAAS